MTPGASRQKPRNGAKSGWRQIRRRRKRASNAKRPVRSLPPSKLLTRPASPRRSVCAPGDDASIVSQTRVERRFPMEPSKDESKKPPNPPKEKPKLRFKIVKLEERI